MLQSVLVATLVFGVGYIGSRVVQELLGEGRDVVGFDNLFSTDPRAIAEFSRLPMFRFVEGSVTDVVAVERAFDQASPGIDQVLILAAQASAHPDAAPADYTEDVNLRGPRVIVETSLRRGETAPIVYASSLRALGSPLPPVVDESSPYGTFTDLAHLSKCYVEKLLELYAATRGAVCRVVRLGLTYGVAPVMKTDQRFMTAPNLFCWQAARGERIVIRTRDPLGCIHVDDAARAMRWAGETWTGPGFAIFNAPAELTTVELIAERVQTSAADREMTVTIDRPLGSQSAPTPWPVLRSAMTRAGFTTSRRLDEAIGEILDHFRVRGQ